MDNNTVHASPAEKKNSRKLCLDFRNKIQTEVNANVVSCILFFFSAGCLG